VRLAYRAAGLSPPEIVWCGGPVALAKAWSCAVSRNGVGANARYSVFDRPLHDFMQQIDGSGDKRVASLLKQGERDPSLAASAAIQSAVMEAVGDIRPRLLIWMNRPRRSGRALRVGCRPAFADCGCGPLELLGAGLAAYAHEEVHGEATSTLRGHRLMVENAGWFVPHEGVCWLSERPEMLNTDEQGRLHCATGPALRYPDGWEVYAWKGAPVPEWIVTQPGRITLRWIDAQIDPRIRHAMIDIFTPVRFIAVGGAAATRDATGTLWKRKWSHRGVVIDSWAAVEVGTGKGLFRCVPAELETPREAFAWIATSSLRQRRVL
jgi:hypothetical protein